MHPAGTQHTVFTVSIARLSAVALLMGLDIDLLNFNGPKTIYTKWGALAHKYNPRSLTPVLWLLRHGCHDSFHVGFKYLSTPCPPDLLFVWGLGGTYSCFPCFAFCISIETQLIAANPFLSPTTALPLIRRYNTKWCRLHVLYWEYACNGVRRHIFRDYKMKRSPRNFTNAM